MAVRIHDLTFLVASNNVYGADLHKERRFLCALFFVTGESILGKTEQGSQRDCAEDGWNLLKCMLSQRWGNRVKDQGRRDFINS